MKTVLVTGASSGIGAATAVRLVEDGYTVYAAARRLDRMRSLEELGARVLQMDVTSEEDVRMVMDRIKAEQGGIDVLVNNAGFALYGAVEEIAMDDARYQFEVNLFGLARLTQLALPSMRERRQGTVVNVSSMGGKIWTPFGAWYHATKHALEGWSDCLRYEVAPFGIDVVVIEPGGVRTEFGDVAFGPAVERSADGAYGEQILPMMERFRGMMERSEGSSRPMGSPPSVIASTISRALKAGRPKTRYVTGYGARMFLFLRRWTSDRIYDRIMRRFAG